MTIYERLDTIMTGIEFELTNARDQYYQKEAEIVDLMGNYVVGAEVTCVAYGAGKVTAYRGSTLDDIIVDIQFAEETKKFSLKHIVTVGKFVKFADIIEIGTVWDAFAEAHNNLTKQLVGLERTAKQMREEAAKKAEADKKAEEKYQRQKAKAIKDFETLLETPAVPSAAEEFYYSLGWLAKHVGSMTAILPDYLGAAFEKHFGAEAPKTLVDSRAKTSGGYAKQWSWEFKCTIKKLNETVVPAHIQNVTTDFAKGIHNTSFLWDLVDNYGFQFGKKQDVEKIRACVPSSCIAIFEAGLKA